MSLSDDEALAAIAKYDQLLSNYEKEVVSQLPAFIETGRAPFEPFFDKMFRFYSFTSFLVDTHFIPDDEKYLGLRILFAKGALSLFGILSCLKNGLVSEGYILGRSLLETLLNIKLILEKDTENRLQLYSDFRLVDPWNGLQMNRRLLAEGKMSQEAFDRMFPPNRQKEIEDNYSRVKSNYHPKRPHHWAWKIYGENPSLRLISDKLDLSDDYVMVYSPLSIAAHNSPNVLNVMKTDKGISLAPNFSKAIGTAGCLGVRYMTDVVQEIAKYFSYKQSEEIHIYVSTLALRVYEGYV